jgi:hypothetical protein
MAFAEAEKENIGHYRNEGNSSAPLLRALFRGFGGWFGLPAGGK